MKGIKYLKAIVLMAAFCIGVGVFTSTAHATTKSVYEVEPNDTMDTAQELEPNETSAATTSIGKEKVNMLYGEISLGDQDWSDRLEIPKDAVVDRIMLSGVKSREAANVTYECVASKKSIKTALYPWNRYDMCDDGLLARSKWNITFGYKQNATFTPYVSIVYFYPIGRDGKMQK